MILDTTLDRQLGRQTALAFRSVLCLLLPGGKRVLYLDGERPGMFDPQGADQIESHVQSWVEEAPRPPEPRARPSRTPVNPRIIRALVGLSAVWLLVGLIFRPAGPAPARVAAPAPPPSASQTANEFIALVRLKQFTPARDLLSSRARLQLAPQAFEAAQMAYLEDADRRWDLQYRRAEPQPSEGIVQVVGPKGSEPWSWTLVREEGRWRLDRFEGGPVSVPDGSPPPPSSDHP